MKILFDHQIFTWQKQGGISRYFAELVRCTSKRKDVQYELTAISSVNVHFLEAGLKKNIFIQSWQYLKVVLSGLLKQRGQFNLVNSKRALRAQQFDVFVPTYYDTYFLEFLGKKPFVLTVYDMIHELYPAYFTDVNNFVAQKKELIHKANKIIAISENTKQDILKIYPAINEKNIEVVHLCHSVKAAEIVVNIKLPDKYILFVGERAVYKNFDFFIQSAATLLNEDKDLFVLCVGGRAFTEEENNLFEALDIKQQLMQYTASDAELYTLYNNAKVFVFPSLYEGFGIPVLEAMASKCPVILTNASSFPEVALDAAAYFNAGDSIALQQLIKDLSYNENKRNTYIEKGLENVKRFSWEKTTNNCIEVYKSVV